MKCLVIAGPEIKSEHNCPIDIQYGHKARGISIIPSNWCPPYFVVGSALYKDYRNGSYSKWENILLEVVQHVFENAHSRIIVRSSAKSEDIYARGKFYSKNGQRSEIVGLLRDCMAEIKDDASIHEEDVSFIVQQHINFEANGHLSNERRCSKEARDWEYEVESINPIYKDASSIHIRNWRREVLATDFKNEPVFCAKRIWLKKSLEVFAGWGYQQEERVHFEWGWDGKRVWLVQADFENRAIGEDPHSMYVKYKSIGDRKNICLLKKVNLLDESKYNKINNVFKYLKLGLSVSPLYLLDDQEIIQSIKAGERPPLLTQDIGILVERPLIIRMDILSTTAERQLLPRTMEINDADEACKWLYNTLNDSKYAPFLDYKPCFIFHNFIPAISSAFAFASPTSSFVSIEALWGLPEGLYYNSHDKFIANLPSGEISDSSEGFLGKIKISEQINYKPYFVAPKETGKWERLKPIPPFDWGSSIKKEEWIKKIACGTKRIADLEGKPVSVMWFVDIQDKQNKSGLMPWYHEPCDENSLYGHSSGDRKKTNWDTAVKVETQDDIDRLERGIERENPENQRIRRITVNPREDKLLRDKGLLKKIGEISKKLDATIVLEGATLSHVYYQLLSTGAVVEVVRPFTGFREIQNFNKLVRDMIPDKIKRQGESVEVLTLSDEAYVHALLDKLIEEAFEAHDFENLSKLIEELTDVQEIIDALLSFFKVDKKAFDSVQKKKRLKNGGFEKRFLLQKTKLSYSHEDKPLGGQMVLIDDASLPSVGISEGEYKKISEKSSPKTEHRVQKTQDELIVNLEMPIFAPESKGQTSTFPIDKRDIRGEISLIREKSKIKASLVVTIKSENRLLP